LSSDLKKKMVFPTGPHALRLAFERDDIDCVLQVLRDSKDWGIVESAKLAGWTEACRDKLRWLLVAHRDNGFVEAAFAGLEDAQRLWPTEPVFLIEMMILARNLGGRYREAVSLAISGVEPAVRLSPIIDLLLALEAAENGNVELARTGFVRVSNNQSDAIRHYLDFYSSLATLVLKSASVNSEDCQTKLESVVEIYLGHFYSILDRFSSIESMLRGIVFFNSLELSSPAECSIRALQRMQDGLTPRGRGSLIFLLLAYHKYENAKAHVDKCLDSAEFASCPTFMKAASSCALALRDPVLERRVLTQWVRFGGSDGSGSLTAIRSKELSARAAAVSADRPIRVFVGMFGQFRSSDSISRTLVGIAADISAAFPGPISMRYGFATWRRSGARRLEGEHDIEFFRQLLPPNAQDLLRPRHGNIGNEVARVFPNLISGMLSQFESSPDMTLDGDQMQTLFPGPATVLIDDEEDIEVEARRTAARNGIDQVPHLNQFKMWSRIARLRDALAVQEAEEGAPFDACIIMRNDLIYLGGDFASLICRVASRYESDRVFCDYDSHAEYIEGLGDRYIVAAPDAASRIFAGYIDHLAALSAEDYGPAVVARLAGHEMFSKILFENGYSATPVYNVNYNLNRGMFLPDSLLACLKMDLQYLSDPVDRENVVRIINELEGVN